MYIIPQLKTVESIVIWRDNIFYHYTMQTYLRLKMCQHFLPQFGPQSILNKAKIFSACKSIELILSIHIYETSFL